MSWREGENRDELTGAYAFEAFAEAFDGATAQVDEDGGSITLASVDIDNFKAINERHGREVGDQVLRHLAKTLAEAARKGALFRHRRDEFIVLFPNTEKEEAFLILERMRAKLDADQSLEAEGKTARVSIPISAGVASYPEDGSRSDDVLRKAGEALHRAKTGGRNRICLSKQERMVTKTSHYTKRQLEALAELAKRQGVGEAVLLREALDDLMRKYPPVPRAR